MVFRNSIFLIFLLFSVSVYSSDIKNDLYLFEKIDYFSMGMNGFIGKKSEGDILYEKIYKEKNAQEIFLNIASNEKTTMASKLYSACGLRQLKYGNLDDVFDKYKNEKVAVLKGDVLREIDFAEVYMSILKHGCE
ncbi:MchS3 family protein [Hafnia paralvei]|uniref:MchS3 family protein n=1 Tax=Hafnia paralvei TaxID=546367 RepID=UPI00103413DB|nr:MchS3 family protein [Hafnia paralvei]TBL61117.1 hypothetical protein EYY97_12265 [Hafnia paralvei]